MSSSEEYVGNADKDDDDDEGSFRLYCRELGEGGGRSGSRGSAPGPGDEPDLRRSVLCMRSVYPRRRMWEGFAEDALRSDH